MAKNPLGLLWANRSWLVKAIEFVEPLIKRGLERAEVRRRLAAEIAAGRILTDADIDSLGAAIKAGDEYVRHG